MADRTEFGNVDAAKDPAAHVGYLDQVSALDAVIALKRRSLELLELRPGDKVLEIGCGNGDEARSMAARVAPEGHVTAIDLSESMIEEARRRGTIGVTFTRMDGHELRFPDESFDACRVERTLQHVQDPPQVVREMARVLRKGGRVVAIEPDWETRMSSATDVTVTRRVVDHDVESPRHRHGRVGRRLPALLVGAGLRVVRVEGFLSTATDFTVADAVGGLIAPAESARDAGLITAQEATDWLADLRDQSQRGAFISSLGGYTVVAEKPTR